MSGPVIGIDAGGTKLSVAVVDANGGVLAREKATVRKESLDATADQMIEAAGRVLMDACLEWRDVSALGLCVPGIYFATTGEAWAPNLWGGDRVPLRDALELRGLKLPLAIGGDREACVRGEQWLGAARGLDDVVFLAIGTGIGAGIVSGGQFIRGASDIAGAVGWFALSPEKAARYKETGCFEAEAAGPAVAAKAGAASAELVVLRARAGDDAARALLSETARWIGMAVANLISAFNPRIVVLGGGLMQGAGDLLLEGIRSEVLDWAQPIAAREARIELSTLGEDAGLLGAARMAMLLISS